MRLGNLVCWGLYFWVGARTPSHAMAHLGLPLKVHSKPDGMIGVVDLVQATSQACDNTYLHIRLSVICYACVLVLFLMYVLVLFSPGFWLCGGKFLSPLWGARQGWPASLEVRPQGIAIVLESVVCITPQMFSCECCVLDCMCRLMHYSLRAVLEYSLTGPSYEWCGLDYCLRAALGLHCVS